VKPVVWFVAIAALAARPGPPITDATVRVIDTWVEAVHKHAPGRPDESVAAVSRLTYHNRADMNAGIDLFFLALGGFAYDTKGNRAAEQVAMIAHRAGMPNAAGFLERAVVLHTDAVIFADRFPQPPDVTEPLSAEHLPPLLTHTPLVKHNDGDVLGTTSENWNWPFARSILDELTQIERGPLDHSPKAQDPFVGAWYHAVASFFFANRLYGDATDHFVHSSEVLPDDARVLFDRGCYAEILGLPAHQVFLSDWKPGMPRPNVPPLEKTNGEAERLFRRALDIDPYYVEARVHLARLLGVRGAHDEAAAELKVAFDARPAGVVSFYAHLFAARESQTRGALGEAAAHYREALALYPNAQSALLGLSQVTLVSGDVRRALTSLERLGTRSAVGDADPWWDYAHASGRDVNELVQQLWKRSSGGFPIPRP